MSDDFDNDNDYWDDMYYYENYDKKMDPNTWSRNSGSNSGYGWVIWLIAMIIICNLLPELGTIAMAGSIVYWIIKKISK